MATTSSDEANQMMPILEEESVTDVHHGLEELKSITDQENEGHTGEAQESTPKPK
ncbi:Hypothetical predicted protein [Mytilus galloprovincialis]|uniref:Uncharacterized protein n=1 Tax=Mytilus galloprovincialis TaxID=29158 RepID=A0A8B6EKU9_MYTGA|nr:Hypothetical predicted protein [Mytilus galloprovincialis]